MILSFYVVFPIPTFLYAYVSFSITVTYLIFLQITKSSVLRIANEQLINILFHLFYSILNSDTIDLLGIKNNTCMQSLQGRFNYKALWIFPLLASPRLTFLSSLAWPQIHFPSSQILCLFHSSEPLTRGFPNVWQHKSSNTKTKLWLRAQTLP